MLLSAIRSSFINNLGPLYNLSEIESIFSSLASYLLNYGKIDIHRNLHESIDAQVEKKFINCLERLQAGESLQYVIGFTEFYDFHIRLDSRVLIPRPETEFMVDLIIRENRHQNKLHIIDLCTGSGCIAIALSKSLKNERVTAMDISEGALDLARWNALENKAEIFFINDNLLTLQNEYATYNLIVSNPPYVREMEKKSMHINVLNNEPELALFVPDNNPLVFYTAIANFGLDHLANEGKVYAEINEHFGEEIKDLFLSSGYKLVDISKDLQQKDRYLTARL